MVDSVDSDLNAQILSSLGTPAIKRMQCPSLYVLCSICFHIKYCATSGIQGPTLLDLFSEFCHLSNKLYIFTCLTTSSFP